MKCPFTNKICIMPKELIVPKELSHIDATLHLCKECGEDYINEQLNATLKQEKEKLQSLASAEPVTLQKELSELKIKIAEVENKLYQAIKREDYESAAVFRDLLAALVKKTTNSETIEVEHDVSTNSEAIEVEHDVSTTEENMDDSNEN